MPEITDINTPVIFENKLTLNNTQIDSTLSGSIRYNSNNDKFEGTHTTLDIDGKRQRPLTQNIATTSSYGVVKVGANLLIDENTGYLRNVASSSSRFQELIITVSPRLGAADYTSITQAIERAIGTPGGGYTDGLLTQESALNNPPNASNSFVILIGPGKYEESQIILPDYVSLIGTGKNECIIQKSISSEPVPVLNTIEDSSIIKAGDKSVIGNFTLNIDGFGLYNVCGIYNNSKEDVIIKNLNINDYNIYNNINSITNLYGLYLLNNSTNTINNISSNISVGYNNNNYVIYTDNSISRITNSSINIDSRNNLSTNQNNYGIYFKDIKSNLVRSKNNQITIRGATNNYGLYLEDSYSNLEYNNINSDGINKNGYGIAIKSSSVTSTTSSNIIYFTHNDNDRDIITSNDTGVVNFSSLGFTKGQSILVSGSVNNNGYYTIFDVSTSQIVLIEENVLITEGATNTITIKEIYNVSLAYNTIYGSNNTIKSDTSNGNFNIESIYNNYKGGDIQVSNDNIITTKQNVITVGSVGCDFKSVSSAVASIVNNSVNNRYIVKVYPGIYNESAQVVMKDYVTIEGFSKFNTILKFDLMAYFVSGAGIYIDNNANNTEIKNITIENNTTGSNINNLYSYCIVGFGNSITNKLNINLCNLILKTSGIADNQNGINLTYCTYEIKNVIIDVIGNTISGDNNIGFSISYSNGTLINNDIKVKNGLATYGVNIGNSDIELNSSNIYIFGNTLTSGINCTDTSLYYKTQINDCNISSPSTINNSFSVRNGSSSTNNTIIVNNCKLLGKIIDNSSGKLIFNKCYEIDEQNNTYEPISNKGTSEENDLQSLTSGNSSGSSTMTGKFNTFFGVNSGSGITIGKHNTSLGSLTDVLSNDVNENSTFGYNSGKKTGHNNISINNKHFNGNTYSNQNDNVLIGKNTGYELIANSSRNIMIGNSAGSNVTVSDNVLIGNKSGYTLTDGINNVFLGGNIGHNSLGASVFVNTMIGSSIMYDGSFAFEDVMIGSKSGYNYRGREGVFIGAETGFKNTSGSYNNFIGFQSGYNNTSGSDNVFVGHKSGYSNNTNLNKYNTFIGTKTGYNLREGENNVLIGGVTNSDNDAAGYSLQYGSNNILLGNEAGKSGNHIDNNILIGRKSGKNIITSNNNVLIGTNIGSGLIYGTGNNVIIGKNSGENLTSNDNLIIGNDAARLNTSTYNLSIGTESGYNVSGEENLFIGHKSGGSKVNTTTGVDNLCIGFETGFNLTSGSNNIIFGSGDSSSLSGRGTGKNITSGSNNVVIGYEAGSVLNNEIDNILIGRRAGYNTSGNVNILIGQNAGENISSNGEIIIGYHAGKNQTIGEKNISIGYESGYKNEEGNYNINLGYESGYGNINGNNNINLGYQTGYLSKTDNNIFLGKNAGYHINNLEGIENIFIGEESGYFNDDGEKNIYMGYLSGRNNVSGYKNICIGSETGKGEDYFSANKNILIGPGSGKNNLGTQHIYIGQTDNSEVNGDGIGYKSTNKSRKNIYIGSNVGISNTDGEFNIALGAGSLENITGGDNNIAFGKVTGKNVTTGLNNILLGNESGLLLVSGDDNIIIGNKAANNCGTDINNNILLGSNSGITIQNDNFIGIGNKAGEKLTTGENNIAIGINSGRENQTISNNILIGKSSGEQLNSGNGNNIFVGNNSGQFVTSGESNICFGLGSLRNGNSSDSINFGLNSGNNSTGDKNISIGSNSLFNNISGENNISLGNQAGFNLNTSDNIFLGRKGGFECSNQLYNIGIGNSTFSLDGKILNGYNVITKPEDRIQNGYNIAIGNLSLENFIGTLSNATLKPTPGAFNVAIGNKTLNNNNVSLNNIALGHLSGEKYSNTYQNNSHDGDNILIGTRTGQYNHGHANIFIGNETGRGLSEFGYFQKFTSTNISFHSDSSNSYIVLEDTSFGDFETIGYTNISNRYISISIDGCSNTKNNFVNAELLTQYQDNVIPAYNNKKGNQIYSNAIYFATYSSGNLENNFHGFDDHPAGDEITIWIHSFASTNIGIGYRALKDVNLLARRVIALGYQAMSSNCSSSETNTSHIAIGINAQRDFSTTAASLTIGNNSSIDGGIFGFVYNTQCIGNNSNNIFATQQKSKFVQNIQSTVIGNNSMLNLDKKCDITYVDRFSNLYYGSTIFGNNSMQKVGTGIGTGLKSSKVQFNTNIGHYSGNHTSGDYNTNIGYGSGYYSLGDKNTNIGKYAGSNNPFGDNNIMIASNISQLHSNVAITLDNTFAVYQENQIENGDNPLLFGNLSNGSISINDRTFISNVSITEDETKLFVNGSINAYGYSPFTGLHTVTYNDNIININLKLGMIIKTTGSVTKKSTINIESQVEITQTEMDKKVYGVYSGPNNNIKEHKIASVGEGCILASNINGNIENGDYICSSNIPGYGMKQNDDLLHSYTVAKCTENIDWNTITDTITYNGNQYKIILCGCTYHCG